MWICSRCQTANKEGYGQCVACSAPRNARRFGAGTPVSAPSIQTVAPERRMQPAQPAQPEEIQVQAPPPYRRQAKPQPQAKAPAPAGGFVRLVGLLLSILLPLLVLAAALLLHPSLQPLLGGLFADPEAAAGFAGTFVYGLLSFFALLLSLVPGLSLFALGHIMRGIVRRK